MDEIKKLVIEISKKLKDDDFIEFCAEQTEKLIDIDKEGESVDKLLEMIENNPEVNFGMPGYIVHFLERFFRRGYEEKLVESFRRKPTRHTTWMLNRLINGTSGIEKDNYIKLLKSSIHRSDIDSETRSSIKDFYNLY